MLSVFQRAYSICIYCIHLTSFSPSIPGTSASILLRIPPPCWFNIKPVSPMTTLPFSYGAFHSSGCTATLSQKSARLQAEYRMWALRMDSPTFITFPVPIGGKLFRGGSALGIRHGNVLLCLRILLFCNSITQTDEKSKYLRNAQNPVS